MHQGNKNKLLSLLLTCGTSVSCSGRQLEKSGNNKLVDLVALSMSVGITTVMLPLLTMHMLYDV